MQTVKRSWLLILNWAFVTLDVAFFVAYFAFEALNVSKATVDFWGITPVVLGICGAHLLYGTVFYAWFSKRNLWFSNIIGFALMGMLFSTVIETSGQANYYYRFGYSLFVLLMNMGGIFGPITAIVLSWLLYFFTLTEVLEPTIVDVWIYTSINVIVTISGFVGWFIFKRFYVKNRDAETIALSQLLQQEQFKANVMLESITDGVMVVNTEGTVQVLNESAARMLGWKKDEALKLDYRSLIKARDDKGGKGGNTKTAIDTALLGATATQDVSLLITKSDKQTYVDIVASPIFETKENKETHESTKQLVAIIAVLRDVDKQKRQEQQRSDFISTASHEMRTPVASVQGFVELALNPKVATIDDKARGYLTKAYEATRHLGDLFQDLLTASQSEEGRLTSNPKIIDVNQFLHDIAEQQQIHAEKKGLKLSFEKNADAKSVMPLLYVHADPDRLREVVLNLLENAIKYTEAGMITIGVTLNDQSITIRVSDTGMGIAPEDQQHLFQKFYRIDNSATREIGGTGLGLYISKQIVDMMHGQIRVESTVGVGSTFFVDLPRISPDEVNSLKQEKPQEV